jgi:hypothetical protein
MNARWRPPAIVAAAQLGAWAIIASGDWPPSGYPLDDAWIHELVARNLVRHGVLGINPAIYGSGATSPVWALLLAVGARLGVPPPWFSNGLNLLLLLLTGQLVFRLLVNDGMSEKVAALLAVAFGCAPNYVWFAMSGMEATLVVFLSVAAVTAWFSPHGRVRLLAGVPVAMLALARPEGALIVPLLVALRRPTSRAEWVSCAFVPAAAVTANALLNLLLAGRLLPSTFAGRRWLWLSQLQGVGPFDRVQLLFFDWLTRLAEFTLGVNIALVAWLIAGVAIFSLRTLIRREGLRALIAWAVVSFAVYAVVLPTFGHGGRYQPLLPSLFLLLSSAGALRLGDLLRRSIDGDRRLVTFSLVALAVVVASAGPGRTLLTWREDHRDAVRHITDTEVATGKQLRTLPAAARIASFDIGGIGYFSERPILEIGGLTDGRIVSLLWQGRIAEYLQSQGVTHLVVPLGYGAAGVPDTSDFYYRLGLDHAPELGLALVSRRSSDLIVWRHGIRATLHSSPVQALYRVTSLQAVNR